jgi:hypothetical protein
MALQPFLELGVRNGFFPAPFRNDSQIIQVFQQLFVIVNGQNHGGFPPFFIRQELNCRAHAEKLVAGRVKIKLFRRWRGTLAVICFAPKGGMR